VPPEKNDMGDITAEDRKVDALFNSDLGLGVGIEDRM